MRISIVNVNLIFVSALCHSSTSSEPGTFGVFRSSKGGLHGALDTVGFFVERVVFRNATLFLLLGCDCAVACLLLANQVNLRLLDGVQTDHTVFEFTR